MKTTERAIERVIRGMPTSDGAGVKLTRLIGTPELRGLDPFLMLDEIRSDDPRAYGAGFPDHPHRGFETVTYVLAGRMRHRDNKGHEGLLGPEGAQWMTAGRGVIHSEMPEQEDGLMWGFQLWLNLPGKDKLRPYEYKDLQASDIPEVMLGDVRARVLAGSFAGLTGPVGGRATEPLFVDLTLPAGREVEVPIPDGHRGFVYAVEGEIRAGAEALSARTLGVLGNTGAVKVAGGPGGGRALVVAGKPLREPVAQYGPFVMNTKEELIQAVEDFNAGRF